jgi:hypothetical protein
MSRSVRSFPFASLKASAEARFLAGVAAVRSSGANVTAGRVAGGAAAVLGAFAYFYTVESEDAIITNMCGVFERGGAPGWDTDFEVDLDANFVPRPALHAQLLALLRPLLGDAELKRYAVVVGASGTGKSTAIRLAVRADDKLGNPPEGPFAALRSMVQPKTHGSVYFLAPTGIASFSKSLMRVLAYREPFSLLSPFRSLVSKEAWDPDASLGSLYQPMASWLTLAPMLQAAAKRFKVRHGRPAVLVLDAMDLVANKDPLFFSEVQDFAKDCADKGILRIVLVFSDGRALPLLESNSAHSRSMKPFEIGDISDAEAVKFLEGYSTEGGRARELVREVTGGRFPLLQHYANSPMEVEDIVNELHGKSASALCKARVESTCPLFLALVAKKSVPDAVARKLMEPEKISALLGLNILATHPDGTYTFHSRHVESFFVGEVERASWWRWWR